MAFDRTTDVMTAVANKLLADGAVTALVGQRIYDMAPEGCATPYLTIGDVGYRDSSTSSSEAQDMLLDVHVWDVPADEANSKNTADVRALVGHVRRVLHDATLTITGRNVILCRALGALPVVADADEIHGVVSIRVLAGHE